MDEPSKSEIMPIQKTNGHFGEVNTNDMNQDKRALIMPGVLPSPDEKNKKSLFDQDSIPYNTNGDDPEETDSVAAAACLSKPNLFQESSKTLKKPEGKLPALKLPTLKKVETTNGTETELPRVLPALRH